MKKILISILFILPLICNAQEIDYPGDIVPKDSALLFAPNLINTGLFTRDFSMTPDGKEIYFSIMAGRTAVIMVSYNKSGEWTEPVIAPFSGGKQFYDFEPHVSPDGNQILFLTTRPKLGQEPKPGWTYQNIFVSDRTDEGWSEPYEIGAPINTDDNEFYPSLTSSGKLYYNHSVQMADVGIYCSELLNNEYSDPHRLKFKNDSNLMLFNATVSRDESYILTCGSSKTVRNQTRYYVAFNLGENTWSDLIDLTNYLGYEGGRVASISLSPEGKYIFFSTVALDPNIGDVYPGMKISKIIKNGNKPQSGSSNIYWISSDFIKDLKIEIR